MTKRFQMDMTTGPIMKKLIIFAIPLILTNVLQTLFHTADVLILGIFTSDIEVGSVGSTSTVISLVVGVFQGVSMGANVIVAKYLGSKNSEKVKRSIGTSMILCIICGFSVLLIGYFFSPTLLKIIDCMDEYYDGALVYMRTYFLGVPLVILYNFSSAIMRASGDTTRPLIFLIIGGILNIILNILFVLFWDPIIGVAVATIASQGFSAILSLICIAKNKTDCKFEFKYFKLYKKEAKEILIIGVPARLQGALFNITNVLIQRNLQSFKIMELISANTLASQFDGFVYTANSSIALATLSFTSQNYGARNLERIKKIRKCSLILIAIVGLTLGSIITASYRFLCSLGINDSSVVGDKELILKYCLIRFLIVCMPYFLCGWMESLSNLTRGIGRSVSSMIITLLGSCVFRIIWVEVFIDILNIKSVVLLYATWPISWVLTIIMHLISQAKLFKIVNHEIEMEKAKLEHR